MKTCSVCDSVVERRNKSGLCKPCFIDARMRTTSLPAEVEAKAMAEFTAGMSWKDVARRNGITPRCVASLIKRARNRGAPGAAQRMENREAAFQHDITDIARVTGAKFGLPPGLIWRTTRKRSIIAARQAAHLLAREMDIPLAAIGRAFEMDHSTIIHSCMAARNRIAKVQEYADTVDRIRDALGQEPRPRPPVVVVAKSPPPPPLKPPVPPPPPVDDMDYLSAKVSAFMRRGGDFVEVWS